MVQIIFHFHECIMTDRLHVNVRDIPCMFNVFALDIL